MMTEAHLKTAVKEINRVIDKETGELLEENIKTHSYIAADKDEFLLMYSALIGVFEKMTQGQIRVFGFLLRYSNAIPFSINKGMRLEIASRTGLNERTIYNVITQLCEMKLLYQNNTSVFYVNPRYAFKGSTSTRKEKLKVMIELGCKDC